MLHQVSALANNEVTMTDGASSSAAPVAPAVRELSGAIVSCWKVLLHLQLCLCNFVHALLQVWRAGQDALEEGEALDYDPTAYDCLHQFTLDWPSLRSAHIHALICMSSSAGYQPSCNPL